MRLFSFRNLICDFLSCCLLFLFSGLFGMVREKRGGGEAKGKTHGM